MTKLKRVLAGSLAVLMAGSALAACSKKDSGGNDKGFNEEANKKAAEAGAFKPTKAETQKQNTEGSEESKKQIRIYTWNEEFKERLRCYYPEYDKEASGFTDEFEVNEDGSQGARKVGEHEYLKDGTEIVWVTTPNTDNQYQNKLDEDLKNQADSDMKIDMFLVEADYAMKYLNGPYTMSVAEVGLTDSDTADQYEYTKVAGSDANGTLQAVSWQATPGLFAYRRDIAKDVFGTDDPEKIQAELADWDKFNAAAAKLKEAGYFMLSGYDDSYRVFSNNVTYPWVNANSEIVIDDNLLKWVDQTKEFTDKGYNNKTSLWAPEWNADQGSKGKVFGFFYSTWGIDFTLAGNAQDNKGSKDGLYGQYAVCPGPQAYFWGGTWMVASAGCDNKDKVADIMKQLTCNKDILLDITKETQDYTNTVSGMQEYASTDFKSEFLGGQNHIALFSEAAPKIDFSKVGPYDQGLNESFQSAMKDYFTGKVDKDTAFDNFYKSAIEKYPELKKPGK